MMEWLLNNLLFASVIFYIGAMTLWGHKKGFFRIAVSLLSLVITLSFSSMIFPSINSFIRENTGIEKGISNIMLENIGVDHISGEEMDKFEQEKAIDSLKLPKIIKDELIKNNDESVYNFLGADGFKNYLIKYISKTVLNIIIFVLASLVIWILLHILMEILDVFAKVPVIHGLNQIAGAVFGFTNALVVLWIVALFIGAMSGTSWGAEVVKQINANIFLKFIFDYNLVGIFMKGILFKIF